MRKIMLFFLIVISQVFSVTVDGYAYLEGQTDHSGVKVFLQRTAPDTNYSYTLYTDSTGYYSSVIEGGVYDFSFSKTGFYPYQTEYICYSDITMGDVTLLDKGFYGEVSGIIQAGVYNVTDTLTVAQGDTLIIEPGVKLQFAQGASFIVKGYLRAEGTQTDSIYFTSSGSGWEGIYFFSAYPREIESVISYSVIEKSEQCGINISRYSGVNIKNSSIRNNSTPDVVSGIHIYGSGDDIIQNCEIINNSGLGFFLDTSNNIKLENCFFQNNSQSAIRSSYSSNIELKGCIIKDHIHWNAAVYLSGGSGVVIEDCFITENTNTINSGGALYTACSLILSNSIISNNTASYGAGIYNNGDATLVNSVISNNNGQGIWTNRTLNINNCIISNNSNYGIYNYAASTPQNVMFNNLYDNAPSNSYNIDNLGLIVTTNYNGDPCDPWYNISMDPLFLDAWNGDFTLTENSPCIDAGTNTITDYTFPIADIAGNYRIWDGDGNGSVIVDMGSYEYGAPSGIVDNEEQVNYQLFQNYPNPFNPITTINYALPNTGYIELNVYNLQGQLVQNLVNGKQDKGTHQTEFNAGDLTSGLYIYNLKVDGKCVQRKKMMLLK